MDLATAKAAMMHAKATMSAIDRLEGRRTLYAKAGKVFSDAEAAIWRVQSEVLWAQYFGYLDQVHAFLEAEEKQKVDTE
jgi:hypothetical protein